MLFRIAFFLLAMVLCACNTGPELIKFGSDDCNFCKMTIIDEKFGAEVITAKGKIHKFDDLNCLVSFLKARTTEENESSKIFVIDFLNKNKFIPVSEAVYYTGEEVHSPMNGNTAAFATKVDALDFEKGKSGGLTTWNDLYNNLR